jgi:hypothetical protein
VLVTSFFIIAEIVVVAQMCIVYKQVAFQPIIHPSDCKSDQGKPIKFGQLFKTDEAMFREPTYFHYYSWPCCFANE